MKTSLTEGDRKALSAYRIEQAEKTIQEVGFLIENNLLSTAANRLYYACYYAALALLVMEGVSTSTHMGVKSMLSLHFVKNNIMPREILHGYILIFECRQRNDYDSFIEVDREEIDGLYQKGRAFVNCVIDILNVRDVQPGNL